MNSVKYLIIGAGPTGLGAAHRLAELGETDVLSLERHDYAGGLAASFTDDAGFTWDIGGHVVFSHYDYFDDLLDGLLKGERLEHERESWVRSCGTWVPYPFQNNIRYLPPEERWKCVEGLLPGRRPEGTPENFHQWIETVFGIGIAETFMWPYNYKVWATPPERMGYTWIGERVSVIDLERVVKNLALDADDVAWGPNNTFKFPLAGGTGEIYRRLAESLGDAIHYKKEVVSVDADRRVVRTSDGDEYRYEYLLNTAPVDIFVSKWLVQSDESFRNAAADLAHNGVFVGGVGVDADKSRFDSRCWMYFPESDSPFYRVTNFHHYSPNNVAMPGKQLGFMCESSFSSFKQEKLDELMDQTVQGLVNTTLMTAEESNRVVTRWEYVADYGYPVPTLERDDALRAIHPRLEEKGIYSRGRFGGWKYEVSNMDHSVMQGVEWANFMVRGEEEITYKWK